MPLESRYDQFSIGCLMAVLKAKAIASDGRASRSLRLREAELEWLKDFR